MSIEMMRMIMGVLIAIIVLYALGLWLYDLFILRPLFKTALQLRQTCEQALNGFQQHTFYPLSLLEARRPRFEALFDQLWHTEENETPDSLPHMYPELASYSFSRKALKKAIQDFNDFLERIKQATEACDAETIQWAEQHIDPLLVWLPPLLSSLDPADNSRGNQLFRRTAQKVQDDLRTQLARLKLSPHPLQPKEITEMGELIRHAEAIQETASDF